LVIIGIAAAAFGVVKSCGILPISGTSGRGGSGDYSIAGDPLPGERYPETRTRLLRNSEVTELNSAQLRYAINEMFARRGACFPQRELTSQFGQFSWYRPRPGLTFDQVEAEFSRIEKTNLELLAAVRESRRRR
jgi:hypothetical protein